MTFVSFVDQVGTGTVNDDISASGLPANRVGFESFSIGDIPDGHLLTFHDVDEVHKIRREEDASDVVDICARYRNHIDEI